MKSKHRLSSIIFKGLVAIGTVLITIGVVLVVLALVYFFMGAGVP